MSRVAHLNRLVFDLPAFRSLGRRVYASRCERQRFAQSTATKFFRNLEQLSAFEGPLRNFGTQPKLRALVAGCSMGCEAFTLGAYLAVNFPKLDWTIDAVDISSDALEVAAQAQYGVEHGLGPRLNPRAIDLARRLFESNPGKYEVKTDIRARVKFGYGDVLSDRFSEHTGYDLVLGQNFMIHMSAADEARAFAALVRLVRPGGVLLVGGMNLDRRPALVASHGLRPIEWNIEEIHNADEVRRCAWPWEYWSLEPVNRRAEQFVDRYATIFLKPAER